MGQLHPLPKSNDQDQPPTKMADATVIKLEPRCALCGAKLSDHAMRHQLVPPQSTHQSITVCRTCHRAALGEGYRPSA
jgi:hypothetical protein